MTLFTADQIDAMVVRIITLIDAMAEVIREDNALLAKGVPASLTDAVTRKASLAAELEQWTLAVRQRKLRLEQADPELRGWMTRRGADLQAEMNENVDRLEAAIEATRRRVDAVMRAMREQVTDHGSYQANGRVMTHARPAPAGVVGRLV